MEGRTTRTVTLGVSSVEETQRQAAAAFRGEKLGEFISFATVELLWKVLTAKRWDILQAMTGQGEMTIREIARRVDRDVKAVHGDVQALMVAGVLDRADSGRVIFPYDAVHVDFTLRKAA
jgi:predicted transcriptional regulator